MNARRKVVGVFLMIAVIVGGAALLKKKEPRTGLAGLSKSDPNVPQSVMSASGIRKAPARSAVNSNSIRPASATVAKRFPDCPVLETREAQLPNGEWRRVEVVKANAKYPFIRVQTLFRRDIATGEETVLHVTEAVADQVIVDLKEGKLESDLAGALASVNGKVLRKLQLDYSQSYLVSLPEPTIDALPDAIAQLSRVPDVIAVADANAVSRKQASPNDPSFVQLWHLRNTAQRGGVADSDIDADEAWAVHTGSSSVLVAISDTGVDYNHFDLRDNIWRNPRERDGNRVDDDRNGYFDDIRGWDFVDGDNSPSDLDSEGGHGTLVAGIIGARGNNGTGIAGVNWYCEMIPLRVLDSQGLGYNSDIAEGFNYAKRAGAKIINASHGGGGSASIEQAIADLEANGVLLVVPAGNDGDNIDHYPLYPASYRNGNIIAVAASTTADARAWFSSYGSEAVDVAAPGVNIFSTSPRGGFTTASGTSFATPVVAGLAALIKAKYPWWNHVQIRNRILASADFRSSLNGTCATSGRVNAYRAVVGKTSLAKATDSTAISWNTGDAPWWGAEISASAGTDWAESGSISHGEQSYLQATVTGPGSVAFWWKVSSETNYDVVTFQINGAEKVRMSGEVGWRKRTHKLGAGTHVLRWTYIKDGNVTSGDDKAWVDHVTFMGVPPEIITQPVSQTVNIGSDVWFAVEAEGHAPLRYQWRKNGVNIGGATNSTLTLTNSSVKDAGRYVVQVQNAYGQTNSTPAVLEFCSALFSPSITNFSSVGGSAEIQIATSSNCWWTALTTNDWISITSIPVNQAEGLLTFSVEPNRSQNSRVGAIFIEGRKLLVTQFGELAPDSAFARDFVLTTTNTNGSAASGSFILAARDPGATNVFQLIPISGSVQAASGVFSYHSSDTSGNFVLSNGLAVTTIELEFHTHSTGIFLANTPEGNQQGEFVTRRSRTDFNGDALNDLVLVSSNRVVNAWCMRGTNFLGMLPLRDGRSLAPGWRVAAVGDLLSRGEDDLLLQNTNGQMAVWVLQDRTNVVTVAPVTGGNPSPGWKAVGLSDFNKDGHLDIVLQQANRRVAVWLMAGTEFLRSVALKEGMPAAAGWRIVSVHDLTGDTEADILWQHRDGRLAFWEMFGSEFIASVPVRDGRSPGEAWRVVAINDLSHDGYNDIVFQHADGRLMAWFMENRIFQRAAILRGNRPAPRGGSVAGPK